MFDEEPDPDPHGECAEEIRRLTNQRDHALDDLKAEIANHREDLAALESMRETAKESSRIHIEMHNRIVALESNLGSSDATVKRLADRLIKFQGEPTYTDLLALYTECRRSLEAIKERVCGEHIPYWTDKTTVTHSRGVIADMCDRALNKKC